MLQNVHRNIFPQSNITLQKILIVNITQSRNCKIERTTKKDRDHEKEMEDVREIEKQPKEGNVYCIMCSVLYNIHLHIILPRYSQ